MKVYIKNMVCQGTKNFVLLELRKLGIRYSKFELGEIDFEKDVLLSEIKMLNNSLAKYGLSIVFRSSRVVESIRSAVLDLVKNNRIPETSFSSHISATVGMDYSCLSKYFMKETGVSIEEYYIEKKIEQMKLNEPSWSEAFTVISKTA